ncbi:hypothetical protein C8R48DRAFT_724927, partial [Suillus tomentosus]
MNLLTISLLALAAVSSLSARATPGSLTSDTVWCSGSWSGCGKECSGDFETRRSCTKNGNQTVEYWCCY